jgi:hypothetical protein
MFYNIRDYEIMSNVTSNGDFIMQNHFVKKRDFFFVRYELNYKRSIIFA